MKRYLGLLLAVILVFSITACGTKPDATESMNVGSTEPTTVATEAATTSEAPETTAAASEAPADGFNAEQAVSDYFGNMPEHIYKIKQDEFVEMVKNGDDMTILDIRSAKDYAEGHVKGAVNLPWGKAISDGLSSIPSDKPVMVYCYTGQTAGQAVAALNMAGFDARSVNLGWNLGIAKVDGVDAVTTKDEATLSAGATEINPAVQKAMDDYFGGLANIADERFKNYKVSEDNLKAMVDEKDSGMYLLSIRKADHFAEGHIEGAANIPFGKDMAPALMELPKDKKIVVYCYTGQTAGQVTAALRLMGYDAVSLNGGMGMEANKPMGWANKGYPVVK